MVENIIREYGLWAVIFGAMIEGELTLLFAGVLAHYGLFSFGEVFCAGTLGGIAGDMGADQVETMAALGELARNSHQYTGAMAPDLA